MVFKVEILAMKWQKGRVTLEEERAKWSGSDGGLEVEAMGGLRSVLQGSDDLSSFRDFKKVELFENRSDEVVFFF